MDLSQKECNALLHINTKYPVNFKHSVWLSDTEYIFLTSSHCSNADSTFLHKQLEMRLLILLDEFCNSTNIPLSLERLLQHDQKQDSVCFTYNNQSLQEFIYLLVVTKIFMKNLVILIRQVLSA